MNGNNVKLEASVLLLEKGVRFTISGAPFLLRLLRLNNVHIRPLKAGTIIELSRLIELYKLDGVDSPREANIKLEGIAHLIAVAMLNSKRRIKWLSKRVTKLLLWAVPANVLTRIFLIIYKVNKVSDFMDITKSVGIIAQMMMSPKNLGQEKTGS